MTRAWENQWDHQMFRNFSFDLSSGSNEMRCQLRLPRLFFSALWAPHQGAHWNCDFEWVSGWFCRYFALLLRVSASEVGLSGSITCLFNLDLPKCVSFRLKMPHVEFLPEYQVYVRCHCWCNSCLFIITDRVRLHEAYQAILDYAEPEFIRFDYICPRTEEVTHSVNAPVGVLTFIIYEFWDMGRLS